MVEDPLPTLQEQGSWEILGEAAVNFVSRQALSPLEGTSFGRAWWILWRCRSPARYLCCSSACSDWLEGSSPGLGSRACSGAHSDQGSLLSSVMAYTQVKGTAMYPLPFGRPPCSAYCQPECCNPVLALQTIERGQIKLTKTVQKIMFGPIGNLSLSTRRKHR